MPKQKTPLIVSIVVVIAVILGLAIFSGKKSSGTPAEATPTPTPDQAAVQLPTDKQPQVNLKFSADSHYVTVNVTNLNADKLEYNLIYDAQVKSNHIQTGVNAETPIVGKSTYTQQQLLGSESSGKFTYHQNIQNAVMELTLRDSSNRSIFTATYPFTVTPGKSQSLTPSQ